MISPKEAKSKTDEELVELTLNEQANFVYIIRRFEKKLISYIRRISGVRYEDAEDILQDTFIKVYKNLNGFDTDLKFSSWIYRITHNEVRSAHRKKMARPQTASLEPELYQNFSDSTDILEELDKKIDSEKIAEILDKIDIKYRNVLVLYYLEQRSYKEIADIIKKPMGSVATLLNRGKKAFQKEYKKAQI